MVTFYGPQSAQANEELPPESSLDLTLTQDPHDEKPKPREVHAHLEVEPLRAWYYRISLNFRCHNPTLAKCGGEAQHFQSWGLGVLRDSRMFRAQQQGPKHFALDRSCCH